VVAQPVNKPDTVIIAAINTAITINPLNHFPCKFTVIPPLKHEKQIIIQN